MPRIDVETGGLRTAGGAAQAIGGDLRGLAGQIQAALADVGGAAPPQTASAGGAFSQAMETATLAVGDGVARLGGNAQVAADVYDTVDRQVMPTGPVRAQ